MPRLQTRRRYLPIRVCCSALLAATLLFVGAAGVAAQSSEGPSGRLARTVSGEAGLPPFSLLDDRGRVLRYIEPSPRIDLAPHLGRRVTVRHDTGKTLLASQLDLALLPASSPVSRRDGDRQLGVAMASATDDLVVEPINLDELEEIDEGNPFTDDPDVAQPNAVTSDEAYEVLPLEDMGPNYGEPVYQTNPIRDEPVFQRSRARRWSDQTNALVRRETVYGRVGYVFAWFDGMSAPPLVTSSPAGTAQADAGRIGAAGTEVFFGGGDLVDGRRNGFSTTLGAWINDAHDVAIEGDYQRMSSASEYFGARGAAGDPILARPYFDLGDAVTAPGENASLISFPGVVEGSVGAQARSDWEGAGLRLRGGLFQKSFGENCLDCNGPADASRLDVFIGYRYLSLGEQLRIEENLSRLDSTAPSVVTRSDTFSASNKFHGADLGFLWDWSVGRWSLELLSKAGIGSTRQEVTIRGATLLSDDSQYNAGLLAQASNSGTRGRDAFTVLPELGVTLGYGITPSLEATLGYSLVYWGRVVRPGDQIDPNLNSAQLPPATAPFDGPSRPSPLFDDSAIWMQSLQLGVGGRF